ncbi:MAG: regulatory protein RecX [Steroidobacteraceae bacterium]
MPGRRRFRASPGVEHPEAPEAARRAALALLARRDHSSAELAAKLTAKGYTPEAAREAIEALKIERFLDDARFLDNFVRAHAGRGQGPLRIRQELAGLGFESSTIDAALSTGPDFVALCREVRARKFGAAAPASWAERGRQARFLQYRGFSSDHIRLATGRDPEADQPD